MPRQRCREDDRAADPLAASRHDEHERIDGEAAQQRADREDREPDREQQLAAVPVGKRARRQQQRGEGEGVGVQGPLDLAERGVQPGLDRRLGDGHDRDVEQQHEQARAHRDEGPPLLVHQLMPFRRGLPSFIVPDTLKVPRIQRPSRRISTL